MTRDTGIRKLIPDICVRLTFMNADPLLLSKSRKLDARGVRLDNEVDELARGYQLRRGENSRSGNVSPPVLSTTGHLRSSTIQGKSDPRQHVSVYDRVKTVRYLVGTPDAIYKDAFRALKETRSIGCITDGTT